ncbi:monocarboxylate transporter 12-like isoform X2 [Mercenaria mercenaria]|uniref:monocarboxylate transporter 12-like isoform X2 n=1 Tax=Mercenaria mercenaria TaxID=6596 RepID=UPI00234E727D|nr:monocarboxylate transporter 12-like isoform X2 [Mercenaria mercenaria]
MEIEKMHRWLVFLSACMVMIVTLGFVLSFGVLLVDFINVFNASRSKASLVQSVFIAVSTCSGLFVGPIMQKCGMKKAGCLGSVLISTGLIISFFANSIPYFVVSTGVVTALGVGFLFVVSYAAVGHHFTEKTALILLSIVNAVSGLGGMLFPFILAYFSETFGLRGTLLLSGGIVMNTIPAALLWTQPEHILPKNRRKKGKTNNAYTSEETESRTEDRVQNDYKNEIVPRHGETVEIKKVKYMQNTEHGLLRSIKLLFKDKCFILFVLGMALAYPPIMLLITFIVDVFTDSGLSQTDANFGLLLMNAFSIGGRLLPGLLLQSRHISSLMVPAFASIVTGVCMAGLILVRSLSLKLVFSSVVGIPLGIFVSCFSVTNLDIVGPSQLGNASGLTLTASGLVSIAAGPVSATKRQTSL